MKLIASSFFARGSKVLSAALAMLLAANSAIAMQEPVVLQDGTPVRLRLTRNLTSANAHEGDTIDFEVLDDVESNGVILVKRGAVALATVTQAQEKRRMGRGGKLDVNLDHVRLANGQKAALRSVQEIKGGGNTGKMTGAIVATSLVFWPAAPLFLLAKGKEATIPKGTEITAYINGDVRFNNLAGTRVDSPVIAVGAMPAAIQTQPVPAFSTPSTPAKAAVTNEDVLALKAAGLADDVIVAKIRSSPSSFRTDASAIIAMKRSGVSDSVLKAMLDAR